MPPFVIYACAAMLFIGAAPLPYGYYTLLRIVVCIVCSIAALKTHRAGASIIPWIFGFIAILFNPFIKVNFTKEAWAVIDIATGTLILVSRQKLIEANTGPSSE